MKKYTHCDLSLNEVENTNLRALVCREVSNTQEPRLMFCRELYQDTFDKIIKLRYNLFLKSPCDNHFLKIKQFHSLESFCLWFISDIPYKGIKLINFTNI